MGHTVHQTHSVTKRSTTSKLNKADLISMAEATVQFILNFKFQGLGFLYDDRSRASKGKFDLWLCYFPLLSL